MKLNIGSGSVEIPGFQNIDRRLGTEAYPLPQFPDNSVDEIRASHILEHFSFREANAALAEWVRVLRPGGRLRIAVPDIHKAMQLEGQMKAFVLMGGQTDENDFHRSAYDRDILEAFMDRAGLENMQEWKSDGLDTSCHPASLNIEGFKRQQISVESMKIKAVMSIPRLGHNDTWGCIFDALSPFRIPIASYQGAFWGQCLQRALVDAVRDGFETILTLDYDSVFNANQLARMLQIFASSPHIDALAPLQMKRGESVPLLRPLDEKNLKMSLSEGPKEVATAHFGMTLLRVSKLKDVPKPWFQCIPGPSGDYDDKRTDGDIYFWNNWRKAGRTVYVAPDVSIGHLETMVAWFDGNAEAKYITPKKWREEMAKCA